MKRNRGEGSDMEADKRQYIGKHLTWAQAVEMFPDLWISFQDCIYSDIDFQSGTLVAVIDDNDIGKYICGHIQENPYFARTTEDNFGGYIHGVLVEKETACVQQNRSHKIS